MPASTAPGRYGTLRDRVDRAWPRRPAVCRPRGGDGTGAGPCQTDSVTSHARTGSRAIREWTVAGAVVERAGALLLVHNRRRNGDRDWSTPGGVIDAADDSVLAGLAREVREETGIAVRAWEGPLYEVTATAVDLGWRMRCEVHRAVDFDGDLVIDDPDGIVIDAAFVSGADVVTRLIRCLPWVREPLSEWLETRWGASTPHYYDYDVSGSTSAEMRVVRASNHA